MGRMHITYRRVTLLALGLGLIFAGALFAAQAVQENAVVARLVEQFGYFGIVGISVLAGFNFLVPVPPGFFTPIFTEAGFSIFAVVAAMTLGTVIADSFGFLLGHYGRHFAEEKYPRIHARFLTFTQKHHALTIPTVFLYAAFVPFPNEAIMIPLAMLGYRFWHLIVPFTLGSLLYHSVIAYGATGVFDLFF